MTIFTKLLSFVFIVNTVMVGYRIILNLWDPHNTELAMACFINLAGVPVALWSHGFLKLGLGRRDELFERFGLPEEFALVLGIIFALFPLGLIYKYVDGITLWWAVFCQLQLHVTRALTNDPDSSKKAFLFTFSVFPIFIGTALFGGDIPEEWLKRAEKIMQFGDPSVAVDQSSAMFFLVAGIFSLFTCFIELNQNGHYLIEGSTEDPVRKDPPRSLPKWYQKLRKK